MWFSDFGLSKEGSALVTRCGTAGYPALEIRELLSGAAKSKLKDVVDM